MQVAFSIEIVAKAFIDEIEEKLGVRLSLFACDPNTAALYVADETASKVRVRIAVPGVVTVTFDEDGCYAVWDVEKERSVVRRGHLTDQGVDDTIVETLRSILM